MRRVSVSVLFLLLASLNLSAADDLAAARHAYDKGDYSTAFKVWLSLAEQGNAEAQYCVGVMYDVAQGYAEAGRWFRKAAEQGRAEAQHNLSVMYHEGKGVPQDYAEAVRWSRKAAEQGLADAQYNLGLMYAFGQGVPQDYAQAVRWYRKAAEQGQAAAQTSLGAMYANGYGVTQDHAEAVRWFRKAAEQGRAEAQYNLGFTYDFGRGVPRDNAEAVRWYRKAAEQGNARAQWGLGIKYFAGEGLAQDYVLAHMWLNLASSGGQTEAAKLRDQVATRMISIQIAEAQALAREWRPKGPGDSPSVRRAGILPGASQLASSGTGFWVNQKGHILTNHHVVEACASLFVRTQSGKEEVKVLAQDRGNDLAVVGPVKLVTSQLTFSENQQLRLGQNVITAGYPLQGLLTSSMSLTTGTVSALAGIQDDTRMVQITAPVQPGNSGGPLLDQSGNVVGIVSSKLNSLKVASVLGDVTQNVNFAVKGSVVRTFLDSSGVTYTTSPSSSALATTVIAEKAKGAVVMIECWK